MLKTALEQSELDTSQEKPIRNIGDIKNSYKQLGILQHDGNLLESQLAMPNSQKQMSGRAADAMCRTIARMTHTPLLLVDEAVFDIDMLIYILTWSYTYGIKDATCQR